MPGLNLLWRYTTLAYLFCLGGLILAGLLVHAALAGESLLLLSIGVVLGVPHGAFDHLVPGWLDGTRQIRGLRWVLGYTVAAGAAVAAEALAPLAAVGALVVLSGYHFADSEAEAVALRDHRTRDRLDSRIGWATSVGMLAVPTLAQPRRVERLTQAVLHTQLPLPDGKTRVCLLVASVGFILWVSSASALKRRPLPAVELALLTLASLVVPPGALFAIVFAVGHSLRHGVRLADLRLGTCPGHRASSRSRRLRPWRLQSLEALSWGAPLGLVLVAGLVAVAVGGLSVVEVSVAGILALSVPHAVVARSLRDPAGPSSRRFGGPTLWTHRSS
jgi:Brp/Blh family beta-carotene 15,15'-monooxygenase